MAEIGKAQLEERRQLIRDLLVKLDPGIARAVVILIEAGVETFESCEGGPGHSFPEPTIRFSGRQMDGFRALGVALQACLPVSQLRRVWRIEDGEPTGPDWELVLSRCLG